jgi:phage-related protein
MGVAGGCGALMFQKKSKKGIKTPQMDVDLIKYRIKRLKEALNETRR